MLLDQNDERMFIIALFVFQFMSLTPQDMQFLSSLAMQCSSSEVQANAIRIIATIGTAMVKTTPTNSALKVSWLFTMDSAPRLTTKIFDLRVG